MTGLGWRTQFITYPSFVFPISFCFIFYKAPDLTWIRSRVSFLHSYLDHGSRQEIFYDQYFTSFVLVVSVVLTEEKETQEQQFLFLTMRLLHKSTLSYILSLTPSSPLKPHILLGLARDFRSYHQLLLPFHFHLPHLCTRDFGTWTPIFTAALSNNYQQW